MAESGSAMKIRNPPGNLGLLVHISFPGQASKGQVSLTVGSRPRSAYVLPNYIPFLRSRASAASAQTSLFILFHHLKSFSELNLTPSSRLIKLLVLYVYREEEIIGLRKKKGEGEWKVKQDFGCIEMMIRTVVVQIFDRCVLI